MRTARARISTTPSQRKRHWEAIYAAKEEQALSWHQDEPSRSLALILEYAPASSRVLDAGGGSSVLAGELVRHGFRRVTVVDISSAALRRGRRRAGARGRGIRRVQADLLRHPRLGRFDVWHDRAVFHFLVRAKERRAYLDLVSESLEPGGIAVLATFAQDGPPRCSGLPVARYSAGELASRFRPSFVKVRGVREIHRTPWGTKQPFTYVVLRRKGLGSEGARNISSQR